MKLGFKFNQIAIAALIIVSAIAFGAMASGYTGLIELQCGSQGCRFVIDGRQPSE